MRNWSRDSESLRFIILQECESAYSTIFDLLKAEYARLANDLSAVEHALVVLTERDELKEEAELRKLYDGRDADGSLSGSGRDEPQS